MATRSPLWTLGGWRSSSLGVIAKRYRETFASCSFGYNVYTAGRLQCRAQTTSRGLQRIFSRRRYTEKRKSHPSVRVDSPRSS